MQQSSASYPIELLDNWLGVTDPKKRRTIQNRINQRATRQRQREARKQNTKQNSRRPTATLSSTGKVDFTDLNAHPIFGPTAEKSRQIIKLLEKIICEKFKLGSPDTDMLLGLTRLNILRALNANLDILGYEGSAMDNDDAQSSFSIIGPQTAKADSREALLPPALRPTVIQRTVPHHPWLDLFPFPKMRDILIMGGDSYDDELMCYNMLGDRLPENSARGETGIIVWKDPWDPNGWEVTSTYIQLWGWTILGCSELFDSTNAWRARRGETPLFVLTQNTHDYAQYCR
ncbi:hypothetical protein BGW36DRAFT_365786 [Talaromyces proteolyticus]|uniref:BZIP domain-containing protein n=1 Tax=Talaromyces proteolyticus TaxID=1131652 RepID=A0AAD4KF06_9EURO|nr:uncharacterized protein BGW36DRAFT_365786 [Talaromyces proteolyticus]KAH8688723.1 hypothetical protein BGW36DRAFT_365786 [Talaromyces proteolyticus]